MKYIFFTLLAAGLLSGCQTYQMQNQAQTTRTRQTEDQLITKETQRRMAGRIETLEMEISRVSQELDALRQTLETRFTRLERKSEADKRELIDRLTAQLEKLIVRATPSPAPTPSSFNGNTSGYEHVVRQGETLSTIASAYNVTSKAIIQANNIKNPDRLSIGQTLFIPE